MLSRSALIVDDERDIRDLVALALSRMGLRVETAADLAAARAQLIRQDFDLCITDMRLPDGNGLSLVEEISARHPRTAVAMMTAYGNVEAAVAALKAGAFDFVTKPVDLAVLRQLVTHALNLQVQRKSTESSGPKLVGDSPALQQLRERIAKVARSQAPVHITGESGTGKELVARLIHAQGTRKDGPFVPVNCGALPADLMESELFGHRKGSFTGATSDKPGLFQSAQGGTLFLDEVAEMPLHLQVKLLRALQEKAIRPVGSTAETPVDVRVLSASHRDLGTLVDTGQFRHDLYYRLNVIPLCVPPLRARPEDIAPITRAILERFGSGHALDDGAARALAAYGFPGNVRELENILERAIARSDGKTIRASDLDLPATVPSLPVAPADLPSIEPIAAHEPPTLLPGSLPTAMEHLEREAILRALDAHRWNRTRTAAALGITFRALRYKLKKLGID